MFWYAANVFLVTVLFATTIVVADAAEPSVCDAALVCVVIVGRLKVADGVDGIARAPKAFTTGRMKFRS